MNQGSGDYPESKPRPSLGRDRDSSEDASSPEPETASDNNDFEEIFSTEANSSPDASAVPSPGASGIDRLRAQLTEKEAQIAKIREAYRGLKKENEKVRKRMEQNQKRDLEKSKNEFIGQFVDVLDNLDRAIESIENNFDSDSVLQGIILLRSRLVQLLRQEGLEKIFVESQPFDPTHSEAAVIEPVAEPSEDNVVLRELQRGYMLRGALLRPARVVVGRFSGSREDAAEDDSPPFPDDGASEG